MHPVFPKSFKCWAGANMKVKVSESGKRTLYCTATSESWGGPCWMKGLPWRPPPGAWQWWENTILATVHVPYYPGVGDGGGFKRKGNTEQADLAWDGAKSIHFFLWSFIIFNFSLVIKTGTAFHCFQPLLGKSFTLSHICLSNSIVSSEVRF